MILHPIAAALAGLSTLMGLVAHLRGFGATCFTTCIASLAATVALLAFVFDIVVFLIAKNRIESAASGESASLGNVRCLSFSLRSIYVRSAEYSLAGRLDDARSHDSPSDLGLLFRRASSRHLLPSQLCSFPGTHPRHPV